MNRGIVFRNWARLRCHVDGGMSRAWWRSRDRSRDIRCSLESQSEDAKWAEEFWLMPGIATHRPQHARSAASNSRPQKAAGLQREERGLDFYVVREVG